VYEQSGGTDGFVSLEVPPYLARDTEGTMKEARRLYSVVGKENCLIKIPGTKEGIAAIETNALRRYQHQHNPSFFRCQIC
jgi:transaldolase